jgi:hypothetical protein
MGEDRIEWETEIQISDWLFNNYMTSGNFGTHYWCIYDVADGWSFCENMWAQGTLMRGTHKVFLPFLRQNDYIHSQDKYIAIPQKETDSNSWDTNTDLSSKPKTTLP